MEGDKLFLGFLIHLRNFELFCHWQQHPHSISRNFCIYTKRVILDILHTKRFKLKFIYSEKATKFYEISTVDLSYVETVKSTVEILQYFVAFSEYMNFNLNIQDYNLDSYFA